MKGLCLIIWMILSVVLACSIVGLILFIPKDSYQNHENTPSTWATIGRELLNSLINNK